MCVDFVLVLQVRIRLKAAVRMDRKHEEESRRIKNDLR